jgi:flavin-dependent dehydrogenase
MDVLVIERERFPRDKPCGGIATLGIRGLVGEAIDSVVVHRPKWTQFHLNMRPICEYYDPDLIFKRTTLDKLLMDLALEEGAHLLEDRSVTGVENQDERRARVLLDTGEEVEAWAVVGADGAYSTVAKSTGLFVPLHARKGVFALHFEERLPSSEVDALLGPPEDKRRQSYFWTHMTGMGWVFRKDEGLNVGIGVGTMAPSDIRQRADRFLDDIGLGRFKDELRGMHIPGEFLPRLTADRVLLVGDAAGAGNPTTGCGIEDSMKTAIHASRVLSDLRRRGGAPTASALRAYEASLGTLRRLQRMRLWIVSLLWALQRRRLDTEFALGLSLRAMAKLDIECFIWSDASRF